MRPPPARVTIAAAQYPLNRFAALADYTAKLERWVADAVARGADLLVFPEYAAMEYAAMEYGALQSYDGGRGDVKDTATGLARSLAAASAGAAAMTEAHAALAVQHGVYILAGSGPHRRADGTVVNRARLFAPSGLAGHQDKQIMTPFERDWGIVTGDGLTIFDTALGTIGVAICYDSEFPLLVRALCAAGADLILVPSCTEFVSGYHRVRTAAMARALENGCVTVQAALVGDAPWSPWTDHNVGAAGIYVPAERGVSDTGVLAEGPLDVPQWVITGVDLDHVRRVRDSGEMRNARDWNQQPGVTTLAGRVDRCVLV